MTQTVVATPPAGWTPARRRRALKTVTIALLTLPALLMLDALLTGTLGARPVTRLIHETGLWTVRLLVLTLAVSPARHLLGWRAAPLVRRPVGVASACYATAHLVLYVVQQHWALLFVATEIVRRIYLLIGFAALCGLVVLALTSTDGAVRRLGRRWKLLHRSIFPIAALGLVHFFMQAKIDVSSPSFYAGLVLFLFCWRTLPVPVARSLPAVLGLAALAALLTAGVEAGWYDAATHVPAWRVLDAELSLRAGPRPVLRVLIVLGLVLAAATIARLARLATGRRGPAASLARS